MSHTPGPWTVVKADRVLSIESKAPTGIRGDPCGESVGTAYRMADAVFMAAAPEMVQRLEDLVNIIENKEVEWSWDDQRDLAYARALLDKLTTA